jgi:uncharacterized membrane-anchored protein YhcB (DUF1043 family)
MKETEKDPWKEWAEHHRGEMDTKEPRDLWGAIEQDLNTSEEKKGRLVQLWELRRVAALFIGLLGLGYFLMYQHFSASETKLAQQEQQVEEISTTYPVELAEAENYYTSEINSRMSEVVSLTDDAVIVEEINSLKEEFDELKEELGDQINDEKLIQAMIQNYRLRLSLLKEILTELQGDGAPKENKKHEERI